MRHRWGMRGARTTMPPPNFNFQTKQSPTVSVSNVRDTAFYECSEIIPNINFTTFTVYATIFGQLTHVFSNYKEELDHFTLDPLKMFSLRAIRKKTTMNKILNNRLLCGILDLLIKSSKTREASI